MEIGYDNIEGIGAAQGVSPQYDGHASWCAYSIAGLPFQGISKYPQFQYLPTDQVGRTYLYDRVGRLTKADFGFRTETEPEASGMLWRSGAAYDEVDFAYDAIGNITRAKRYSSTNTIIDNLTYSYGTSNSHLLHVDDTAPVNAATEDVDDQAAGNYSYAGTGAVTADLGRGVGLIVYDAFGLPTKIVRADGSYELMRYNAAGQRVFRTEIGAPSQTYVYGADGTMEAVSVGGVSGVRQFVLNGASPIGKIELNNGSWSRHYYLRDEHGSVRVVVNSTGGIESRNDFFVFGGFMPGRYSSDLAGFDPRFLANEKDAGTGYDLMALRLYDSRVGRFLGVDPYSRDFPDWSPFCYGLGDPVRQADRSGGYSYDSLSNSHDQETARLVEQYPEYPFVVGGLAILAFASATLGPPAWALAGDWITIGSSWLVSRLPVAWQNVLGTLQQASNQAPISAENEIQFAQRGVSGTFRYGEFAGRTISDVVNGLRSGTISPDQIPIQTIVRNGITYTLNNRSLMALRQAGLEPTVVQEVTGNAFAEAQLTQRLLELGDQVGPGFIPVIRGGGN